MIQIKEGDFVALRSIREMGVVTEVLQDPLRYQVLVHGTSSTYYEEEVQGLTPAQVRVLNSALKTVANVIDYYVADDIYDPVYGEDGDLLYSSAAAAVFKVLDFANLIVQLGNQSDKIALLEKELSDAARSSH